MLMLYQLVMDIESPRIWLFVDVGCNSTSDYYLRLNLKISNTICLNVILSILENIWITPEIHQPDRMIYQFSSSFSKMATTIFF